MWKRIISEMSSAYLEQMYFGSGVCLLVVCIPVWCWVFVLKQTGVLEGANVVSWWLKCEICGRFEWRTVTCGLEDLKDLLNQSLEEQLFLLSRLFMASPGCDEGSRCRFGGFLQAGGPSNSAGADWMAMFPAPWIHWLIFYTLKNFTAIFF